MAAFLAGTMTNRLWLSDFWEHAAAIRELATHPLHPQQPVLGTAAPHAFFTPFSLLLAMTVRLAGITPEQALTAAGVVNLVLLPVAFRSFAGLLAPRLRDSVAFHAVLFMLLLCPWMGTWLWIEFLHLEWIWMVLPYPSTLATGLSLLAIVLARRGLSRGSLRDAGMVGALLAMVVTIHPTSFLFAGAAVAGLTLTAGPLARSRWLVLLVQLAVPVGAALLWPYYPVLQVLAGLQPNDPINVEAASQYTEWLPRAWPLLPGVALLLHEGRRPEARWLWIAFGVPVFAYLYGYVVDALEFGGVVFYAVLLAYFALAVSVARIERAWFWSPGRWALGSLVVAVVWSAVAVTWHKPTLWDGVPGRPKRLVEAYYALTSVVGQYEMVIADEHTDWMVPATSGKTVAWDHPVAFVPDVQERRDDVERFFDPADTCEDRRRVLQKYHVQYVLMSRLIDTPEQILSIEQLGLPGQDFDHLRLLHVENLDHLCGG